MRKTVAMRKTPDEKKQELLDGLRDTRSNLLSEAARLSPEQQDAIFLGTWSAKDLLAHLIGWDFTNQQAIQEILAGAYPEFFQHYDKDWRTYNALLVELYRIEPFSALFSAAENSHRQFLRYLESLPANEILNGKARRASGRSVSIRNLLASEISDERVHTRQLQDFFV
jgi:hypothetical protein